MRTSIAVFIYLLPGERVILGFGCIDHRSSKPFCRLRHVDVTNVRYSNALPCPTKRKYPSVRWHTWFCACICEPGNVFFKNKSVGCGEIGRDLPETKGRRTVRRRERRAGSLFGNLLFGSQRDIMETLWMKSCIFLPSRVERTQVVCTLADVDASK